MLLVNRKSSVEGVLSSLDCIFHGSAIPVSPTQADSSPYRIEYAQGEGLDMLYGSLGQTLGPRFAETLQYFASLLDPHPQDSEIKLNVDERLDWLRNTYPPSVSLDMSYRALEFYRNVFEAFCPEIFPAFFSMLETEAILYAQPNPKAYREHLAHPVYVFLAGRRILDCPTNLEEITDRTFARLGHYQDFVKRLTERLPKRENNADKDLWSEAWGCLRREGERQKQVILLAWVIVGLCHDLGYPTWHAARQASRVKNDTMPVQVKSVWSGSPELTSFIKDSLFFCELRRRHMDYTKEEDLTGEVARSVVKNHSFASALTVLSTLRVLLNRCQWALSSDDQAGRVLDFAVAWELAAEAIALHDADSSQKAGNVRTPVSFSTNPLAWLLRTMDLIEEWDRPVHWAGTAGGNYLIPFEAVAVRVIRKADGKCKAVRIYRLLNRELLEEDSTQLKTGIPFCPAHWPGYWSDFEAPVPEPSWRWGDDVTLEPFIRCIHVPGLEHLCALHCWGSRERSNGNASTGAGSPSLIDPDAIVQHSPDYFYENRTEERRPHSRCLHNFWAQDVEAYLNTGSNAEDLGRMLTRLSEEE